ncbi:hypothetical protein [uncultured Albimonas sp.]|uniref:hypothetical protein n=1 Tax=uncultured Albimonas sp. TaxID=1331701 RepID=UPI0030EF2DD9|tara:strand:+ start:5080 stop:5319 length:240 start_codon:yes stop_codon:yes gene_type:complete
MPRPDRHLPRRRLSRTAPSTADPHDPGHDWRCRCCGGLLGRVRSNRLHIRMKGCSEYFAALPCTATCRTCGGLNEVARD